MNKFIMMCGLPASGKSTISKELAIKENAVIHASDELRKELFRDENTNDKNDELFLELHKRIKNDLRDGKNAIYDATNINYKRRKSFLDELKKIECYKECVIVATPYEDCIRQNKLRERNVPDYIIRKMYMNFYVPQLYEGWNEIRFIHNFKLDEYKANKLFDRLDNLSQDNSHHTLTVGEHCKQTALKLNTEKSDYTLIISALYHDVGKEFTKCFKNTKGEETKEAHYYQHHLISAYDSMFYLYDIGNKIPDWYLKILGLITWHMQPFFIQSEKAKEKFINLVGEEFYDKLMVLHEADIIAK